jgi:NADH:ubiquinone oxidoreductase subunit F (NADH-binding)/NADH:ubiquinone oxidoreductase subunit E
MTNKKIKYQPVPPEITELVARHGNDPESLLEVLVDLETHPAGLSPATVTDAARALRVPPHKAYGMATFYSMLSLEERKNVLRVCDGPVCWLKRATEDDGLMTVEEWQTAIGDDYNVERTSCLGLCDRAPAVLVDDEQAGPATPPDAQKLCEGWRGVQTDYSQPRPGEVRVMMADADKVDPDSIDSALEYGAYEGLKSALQKKPEEVLEIVEDSGLQGRGGAGFPVGRKWKFVAGAKGSPKYMICNADESEPLIFKDRVLIDTNPHQILEGMIIGGYACGASEAWIYIRGEYEYQARRLERAIQQAEEKSYLGKNILDSGFSFKIHVHRGAGAYICGEETALIESLEGKRGEPRMRPPYPPSYGFRGKPTAVNNVESYAAVPNILRNGVDWWKSLSNYSTPGTKMYMVLGHVKNPGLFEAPFGITLRQIIDDFGGGTLDGSEFQFALCGGAAGTVVNESMLDVPIDFASSQKGVSLGAGSFLIIDQNISPVAFLREILHFFAAESCGKCTPCRVGTWRAMEILTDMADGRGKAGDMAELRALSDNMQLASFCALGQSVPIPMNSAMKNFEAAFNAAEK